jgi:hypothetical protein
MKRLIIWLSILPKAIKLTVSRWIAILQHTIAVGIHGAKIAVKAVLYTFVLLILVPSAVTTLILLLKLCLKYHRNRQKKLEDERWRRQREEIEQRAYTQREATRRGWQQRDDKQRKHREEQERRQREQAENVDENLRRERERKQRQTEQEKRRQAVLDGMAYKEWESRCLEFLAHRERMTSFPEPPYWPCTDGCADNTLLKACRHSVRRLYIASGNDMSGLLLKKEKLTWHPDKFGTCPPLVRERIQAKATELFKIIQTLEEEYNAASQSRS